MGKQKSRESLHLRISTGAVANENENITAATKFRTPEENALTAKITSLGRSQNWHDAYVLFKQAEQKDLVLYNAILSVARRCGKFREACSIFPEMRKQKSST